MKIQFLTVNYNNLVGLKRTTESIVLFAESKNAAGTKIFWVIKDAISTDGSQDFINQHIKEIRKENLDIQIEISKDNGIFSGMNGAIILAKDDILTLFLNSGDFLSREFIYMFDPTLFEQADVVYGNYYVNEERKDALVKIDSNLDFEFVISKMINHQSLFINSSILKKNLFKEEFWVNADWVQLFDIMRAGNRRIQYLDFAIPVYELGGNSDKFYQEGLKQREEYLCRVYSGNELDALKKISRLRQRKWYAFILKALDSPKRSWVLKLIARF